MLELSASKTFNWHGAISDKALQLCRVFGLTLDRLLDRQTTHKCRFYVEDGDIVYITGPSGSGKSVLLNELQQCVPDDQRVNLGDVDLPHDRAVIDCIQGNLLDSLRALTVAGLSDCFCTLNQPDRLSEGQKWRFRFALALSQKKKYVFADEFCSNLDRLTATLIASKVNKFAAKTGTIFILASAATDILSALAPDVLVVNELNAETEVIYKDIRRS